jgi:hypothetical protein
MGAQTSQVPEGSPLAYLLKHWKNFDPENLWKKVLIFYCSQAWPKYPLGDQQKWPEEGSINCNTILQLDLLCRKKGKWMEVPYVQLFFYLWDYPKWIKDCKLDSQTLAILCRGPSSGFPELPEQQESDDPLDLPPLNKTVTKCPKGPESLSSPRSTSLYPDLKDHYNSTAPLPPYLGESTTRGQEYPRSGLFPL